jgi:hypothetical protein
MTNSNIEGTCLCGAVTYRITGKLLGFQYCHCSRCRRFTGSAHAANVFVVKDDLEWVEGADSVGTFLLEGEPSFRTAFCKTCGSSMPSLSTHGDVWVIPAGPLGHELGITPKRSIFWDSRAPWYKHVSDLPTFATMPDKAKE